MEYLDLYDQNYQLTGEIIERQAAKKSLPPNRYIKVVQIFIENKEGKFLIQYTSKEKGNEIATTGGCVQTGQTSEQSIIREVQEELGQDISNENFKYIDTFTFNQIIVDVYYLKKDYNINDLKLQKEEVDHVEWLSQDEIQSLIDNNTLRKSNCLSFKKVLQYKSEHKDT